MKRQRDRRPKTPPAADKSASSGFAGFLRLSWDRGWLPCLLISIVTFIAYQPVWHAGFIWDDDEYVTSNFALHTLHGLQKIWFEPGAVAQYYPLTFTSFWVEYHLWGLNPLGYHLINVLLHALNAILLWLILRKLGVRGAWLAAGIFALHPVGVESVAWVTERKNTLSGFFYLCSALAALKFWLPSETVAKSDIACGAKDSTAGRKNWRFYWLALALYVCALWSKTATMPLPAIILLLLWWRRGNPGWRDVCPLLTFLAVGVAMGLVTLHVENRAGMTGNEWRFSWLERCLVASRAVWFYLGKLLWPHPLMSVYPRWDINASQISAYLPMLAAACVTGFLWWKRKGWGRPVLFTFAYFLALLFLVLGFFNINYFRYSFVSDHFQYLASLGPLTLAAAVMAVGVGKFRKSIPFLEPALYATLLLALGVLTWQQCGMYADAEMLWRTTIERNPDCWVAHNNFGSVLYLKGQRDEAVVHYQTALEINPSYADAHNNLGVALASNGQVDESIPHFQKALEIQPKFALAHSDFGNALLQNGRVDEAIMHFQTALAIQPENEMAHNNLGNALLRKGRVDEAIEHYQKALEIQPEFALARINLGNVLLRKGRVDEAIMHFQKALEVQSDNEMVHNDLGNILLQKGQMAAAIVHFQKALEIRPGYADACYNLGHAAWVLATCPEASVRNGVRAVELAEQVDRLSGGRDPIILGTLAAAYAEAGRYAEAVGTAQHALELALAQNDAVLADAIRTQIKFYQAGSPFRDTSQTHTPVRPK
jgi:tetratricopeptide (TPR) repeat protein